MMWILLGYYIASVSGDGLYPFQGVRMIENIRHNVEEVIVEKDRRNNIFTFLKKTEEVLKEDNNRDLEPLRTADQLIENNKIETQVLESLYLEFSNNHIHSIRKNTKAFLELKKQMSREEWELIFEKVMSETEP